MDSSTSEKHPRGRAKTPKLVLHNGEKARFNNPSLEFVQEILCSLEAGNDSFVILERGKEYVQTIRGLNGFHVELQEYVSMKPRRSEHYKVGRNSTQIQAADLELADDFFTDEDTETGDPCLPGFSNELLERDEVIVIFSDFWHGKLRSGEFTWRAFGDFTS
jgi:hypothetical protein